MAPEEVVFDRGLGELGDWSGSLCSKGVPELDSMMESKGPQVGSDNLGPPVRGMEQHGPGLLNNVSDPLLHLAILMMSTNSTEADGLPLLCHMFPEELVSKPAIVSMTVLDGHIKGGSKSLKGFLGFNSFFRGVTWSDMDKGEV